MQTFDPAAHQARKQQYHHAGGYDDKGEQRLHGNQHHQGADELGKHGGQAGDGGQQIVGQGPDIVVQTVQQFAGMIGADLGVFAVEQPMEQILLPMPIQFYC